MSPGKKKTKQPKPSAQDYRQLVPEHFSMVSAQKGASHDERMHSSLASDLELNGLKPVPVKGNYGYDEQAFMVPHRGTERDKRTVEMLGWKHGQESVLHSSGRKHRLVFRQVNGEDKKPEWTGEGGKVGDHQSHYTEIGGKKLQLLVRPPRDVKKAEKWSLPLEDDLEKAALPKDYSITHTKETGFDEEDDGLGPSWRISAKHQGKEVGWALFHPHHTGGISADAVSVKPEHRRKGLATAMYAHAEKASGKHALPGVTSPEGESLWRQPNRPFGQGKSKDIREETLRALPGLKFKKSDPLAKAFLHNDGETKTDAVAHSTALSSLPSDLLQWGVDHLVPMEQDEKEVFDFHGHHVKVRKHMADLYSGWLERDGEITHSFSRATLPEFLTQLQSKLELYGTTKDEDTHIEPDGDVGMKPEAFVKEHEELAPKLEEAGLKNEAKGQGRELSEVKAKLEYLREGMKPKEESVSLPVKDIMGATGPAECAACERPMQGCLCYSALPQPRVTFDGKVVTLFFKSEFWNEEDRENFVDDFKVDAGKKFLQKSVARARAARDDIRRKLAK